MSDVVELQQLGPRVHPAHLHDTLWPPHDAPGKVPSIPRCVTAKHMHDLPHAQREHCLQILLPVRTMALVKKTIRCGAMDSDEGFQNIERDGGLQAISTDPPPRLSYLRTGPKAARVVDLEAVDLEESP